MNVLVSCPYCGFSKRIPKERLPGGSALVTCPRCGQQFRFSASEQGHNGTERRADAGAEGDRTGRPVGRTRPPWERRSQLGLWQSLYGTFKAVLFAPRELFRSLTFRSGLREPLAFGLLAGSLTTMVGIFWHFLVLAGGLATFGPSMLGQIGLGMVFIVILLTVPVWVVMGILMYSGIVHIMLLVVRGGRNGFEATFRVISYSQAAQIWSLVPLVGGLVGAIWQIIVQVIGLREIHETSYLRVGIAFLIPVVLVVLLFLGVLIFAFMHARFTVESF